MTYATVRSKAANVNLLMVAVSLAIENNDQELFAGEESNIFSVQLREVPLLIVNNTLCNSKYKGNINQQQHICAGDYANGGRDSCKVRIISVYKCT